MKLAIDKKFIVFLLFFVVFVGHPQNLLANSGSPYYRCALEEDYCPCVKKCYCPPKRPRPCPPKVDDCCRTFFDDFRPYMGWDFQYLKVKRHDGWTDIVPSSYPGGTWYVGAKLHPFYGFELGYDWSTKSRLNTFFPNFPNGTPFVSFPQLGPVTLLTDVRINAVYLEAQGYYPLCYGFELFGSLGFASMKPVIGIFPSQLNGTFFGNSIEDIAFKSKFIFESTIGLNYFYCNWLGFRTKIKYQNTRNLHLIGFDPFEEAKFLNGTLKPFRDTLSFALGFFIIF